MYLSGPLNHIIFDWRHRSYAVETYAVETPVKYERDMLQVNNVLIIELGKPMKIAE